MNSWTNDVLATTESALAPLTDPKRAVEMAAYMKHVAPFLGIATPPRRAALRAAWKPLPAPSSTQLGDTALALFALPEREYHYAACDLIDRYRRHADDQFLARYVQRLLTTTPWWDTVDGLGSVAVSPLCRIRNESPLVLRWAADDNMWLNRAAIQHQRGWSTDTDVPFVLSICDRHAASREFFIVKAIGWALRDIARFDAPAVRQFLADHPGLGTVAVREANRHQPFV